MKINPFGPMGTNPYQQQQNKVSQLSKPAAKLDKVEISSAAKQLQETSPVTSARQEKVEALKQQVQTGNYQVDAKATAKGIYDFYFKK